MSENHEEVWAEMERLSRRMALQYQECLSRIIELEDEVAALKGQPEQGRATYGDAQPIDWRDRQAAPTAIAKIMQH